jgi:Uncharacterized lipoprotein NlpE involved in copper resistance
MVALVGCSRNQNSLPVGDTSRNSLDWQGVYHGVLPCADCAGILAMIELNENNTYTLSTSYIGKNNAGLKKSGDFTWNDAGGEITLNGLNDSIPPVYKVGENRLIPMNPSVDKARRDQYLLTRNNPDITNKYWQLVRINCKTMRCHLQISNEERRTLFCFRQTVRRLATVPVTVSEVNTNLTLTMHFHFRPWLPPKWRVWKAWTSRISF